MFQVWPNPEKWTKEYELVFYNFGNIVIKSMQTYFLSKNVIKSMQTYFLSKKKKYSKRFFTKVDFRAIFLLFTASVLSQSPDQPLVPGV